jgi:hypothetical protein
MDHRTRVRSCLQLKETDRLPFIDWWGIPHYRAGDWEKEGLPAGSDIYEYVGFDGSDGAGTAEISERPLTGDGYMYLPKRGLDIIYLRTYALPKFAGKSWTGQDGYLYETNENWGGVSKRIPPDQDNPLGAVHAERYAVETRDDWVSFRERFNGRDEDRYIRKCDPSIVKRYDEVRFPVELKLPGPWGSSLNTVGWSGKNNFFDRLSDEPEFIREMLEFFTDFAIDLSSLALQRLKIDFATIEDGIAYDGGAWTSKTIFREFLMPCYQRITSHLKKNGISVIFLNSGGSLTSFIPDIMASGINGLTHVSVQAGMDLVSLKKTYGPDLRLIGGIDRRIISGTREDIDREVARVMSIAAIGGVIPCLDASVLYGASLANYLYYTKVLRSQLGVNGK